MVRGIRIDPGQPPEVCNVPDTAQGLDALLGGPSTLVPFATKPAALVCALDLSGKTMPTRYYAGTWYYGRLLIVGWKRSRLVPLPEPLAHELAEHFTPVEVARL